MLRAATAALLLGWLTTAPLAAQESAAVGAIQPASADAQAIPDPDPVPSATPAETSVEGDPAEAPPWQTAWGLIGLRIIPEGSKVAPNGVEYHPNFSIDLDFDCWLWQSERLYLFSDMRFWGEKGEYGVTNARDGALGTSKRQFDLVGGAAWNYAGPWEARAFGYSLSNLNRGESLVTPSGIVDGFGMENRYYLSADYSRLGQTGFDVSRESFLSIGYYPSKDMVGNDGKEFQPGLLLRAYLTQDLWDWPCYAFVDGTFIGERPLRAKLLLLDAGLAARPFSCCQQCEFRVGVEATDDVQVGDAQALWYASIRYIF